MPTTLHENRPSAGIGVVEVQKLEVFCDFCGARATLCGDRRGRCAKTQGFFCDFCGARATLCEHRRGRGAKTRGFLRFLKFPRNPLRESAWSRCKKVFCKFCCSNWSSGVVSWFACLLPGPAGRGFDSSLVRGRASQDATCTKQLAQSNLRRASCTEHLAHTNLHRRVCAERLA